MNVFVFDIKTIPDIDGCRNLFDLHGLSDDDVAKAIFHKRRQEANSEQLRHHLHKIVTISAVLRTGDQFKVWSLGNENSDEQDLLQRFHSGLARYTPRLVSWNGTGFDLPVIRYRSLLYPVNAAQYWEAGQSDSRFINENYLDRYHERHTDLKDLLAGFQSTTTVPLNELATLCGFPGGSKLKADTVWNSFQAGDIQQIRHYCEANVLNTYLVYLNLQRNRGHIDQTQYQNECQIVRDNLLSSGESHLTAFEKSWHPQ